MVNGTDVASNPHGEGVAPRSTKRHSARHNAVFSSTAYGQSARTPAKRTNVVQTQTEPRHFAPQARADVAAGLTQQPPPRFMYSNASFLPATDGAGVAAIQEGFGPGTDTDPFYSPSAQYGGTALPSQNNGVYSNNFMAAVPLGPAPPLSYCVPAPRSPMLMMLTQGPTGLPSKDIALDPEYFPFMNSMTQAQADQYGVVKLKNIPFSARRSDIIAFFGRSSKLVNDRDEPVHIIMERTTSKTQDAYAEFITLAAANEAIEQKRKNRIPRLGDRPVELELSSQSALMKDLFPHADGVYWNGGEPEIQPPKPGVPCTTFKGFVQNEEMTVLVKHVEDPRRSKYSGDCPQRPYECLISIIKKLPWYKSEHITVGQRHAVYKAAMDLIKLLQKQIYRNHRNEGGWVDTSDLLNRQLLKRLVMAAMLCPGFSVLQKDNIALVSGISDEDQRNFNQPRFAKLWTHQLTLCPKPNRPIDVLEWYISIIRENTTSFVNSKPLDDRQPIQAKRGTDNGYFGYLWHEIDFPAGKAYDKMTLEEAARKELAAIELVLRRAFSD
ncbi:hypothetical protein QBC46DRAFT_253072 [Diplogelasinospora grovesii]|uniref:RRM domain-containing protein n=1 Tax=Diplogelasinospora grovesii TaxID=303347 RepID=A0AAN6S846_9PEZI|nr:hypothetical protein QBC46DRAFT_253072 [Diplogelasinospora grovesii]